MPSRWPGGEPPALKNRDQKLVGSAVMDASPAWKPIQPCTQVAGVHLPMPGSEAATSIATNAAAVVAIVPMVFRVATAASRPIAANTASTSNDRATCELARVSALRRDWWGSGRWSRWLMTGPATASATQQAAIRPIPASQRLTSLAASTCHLLPCWVSRFFMVRPDHSPPEMPPSEQRQRQCPGQGSHQASCLGPGGHRVQLGGDAGRARVDRPDPALLSRPGPRARWPGRNAQLRAGRNRADPAPRVIRGGGGAKI